MHAGPLHRPEIEIVTVQELGDHHPEGVVIGQLLRHHGLGQTTEQAGQLVGGVGEMVVGACQSVIKQVFDTFCVVAVYILFILVLIIFAR